MAKAAKEKEQGPKYIVKKAFNDQENIAMAYPEGTDVSHFDEARLKLAIYHGLVERIEDDK